MAVVALATGAFAPIAAAGPGRDRPEPHELELTMLATTDLHGRIQDWDYFRDAPYSESSGDATGLARVASAVESVREARREDSVLVVDNGDAIQGTPLTYYYAKQEPVSETDAVHPMAAAYNTIGYDAQVVGNHEYNYGLGLLNAYVDDADHPVLGANVVEAATGRPYHQPYTLKRMKVKGHKPVTVGILGLTTPGSAVWDRGNVEGTLEFRDMVETAQEWVPRVAEQADVVVVLSHAGVGGTSSYGPELPVENPSDVIARTVPGIDVMVVGHTHRDAPSELVVNEVTGEEVLLTQPYRWERRCRRSTSSCARSAAGGTSWAPRRRRCAPRTSPRTPPCWRRPRSSTSAPSTTSTRSWRPPPRSSRPARAATRTLRSSTSSSRCRPRPSTRRSGAPTAATCRCCPSLPRSAATRCSPPGT